MKKQKQQPLVLQEREPAQPGTIGVIFDFYRSLGYTSLPDRVQVNGDKLKSQRQ